MITVAVPSIPHYGPSMSITGCTCRAACVVYTCRRLIDLSNDCRYDLEAEDPTTAEWVDHSHAHPEVPKYVLRISTHLST